MSRLGVLGNTSALAGFAEYGVTVGKDSKQGTCKGERAQPARFLRRCLGKASPCPGLTAQFAATLFGMLIGYHVTVGGTALQT